MRIEPVFVFDLDGTLVDSVYCTRRELKSVPRWWSG